MKTDDDIRSFPILRLTLWAFVLFAAVAGVAIVTLCWPKKVSLSLNPDDYIAYYWGNDFLFGRHFYRVVVRDGQFGYWEVSIGRPGYNAYRGFYPDGTVREEGEVFVTYRGLPLEPHPDNSDVRWGNYYLPNGTLGASIRDGSGMQVYWYPNGNVRWKVELKNYKRIMNEAWSENGTLLSREEYDERGTLVESQQRHVQNDKNGSGQEKGH